MMYFQLEVRHASACSDSLVPQFHWSGHPIVGIRIGSYGYTYAIYFKSPNDLCIVLRVAIGIGREVARTSS
jgi:hypothetical protein